MASVLLIFAVIALAAVVGGLKLNDGGRLSTRRPSRPKFTFVSCARRARAPHDVAPRRSAPRRRLSGVLLLMLLLVAPVPARAGIVTALKLTAEGVALLGDFAGGTATLLDIFKDVSSQSDDHPLYTAGQSSPSLTIAATGTTFDLLLKQTNDVGEPEDDLAGVLEGTTSVDTPNGQTVAWKWKLTIEADINTVLGSNAFELEGQGFVQHLFRPHPAMGEQDGVALNYNLSIVKNAAGGFTNTVKDDQGHPNGPHKDILDPANLTANFSFTGANHIDSFDVRLKAFHTPEPSSWLLLATAMLGIPVWRWRMTRRA